MTPSQWNEYQRQADVIEQHQKWKDLQKEKENTTSVQWLQQLFINNPAASTELIEQWFNSAKRINEEEIKCAYTNGRLSQYDNHKDKYKDSDDYFNVNFKSN